VNHPADVKHPVFVEVSTQISTRPSSSVTVMKIHSDWSGGVRSGQIKDTIGYPIHSPFIMHSTWTSSALQTHFRIQ
jgi:hypothetical protein